MNGVLAVTRAFGDIQFKKLPAAPSSGRNSQRKQSATNILTAEPEISVTEGVSVAAEFVVIASDGLWDVMSPGAVVKFVAKLIDAHMNTQLISRRLVTKALSMGSIDNISIIILTFATVTNQ